MVTHLTIFSQFSTKLGGVAEVFLFVLFLIEGGVLVFLLAEGVVALVEGVVALVEVVVVALVEGVVVALVEGGPLHHRQVGVRDAYFPIVDERVHIHTC